MKGECPAQGYRCSHCSGDHTLNNCTNKSNQPTCVICGRDHPSYRLELCNHPSVQAMMKECSVWQRRPAWATPSTHTSTPQVPDTLQMPDAPQPPTTQMSDATQMPDVTQDSTAPQQPVASQTPAPSQASVAPQAPAPSQASVAPQAPAPSQASVAPQAPVAAASTSRRQLKRRIGDQCGQTPKRRSQIPLLDIGTQGDDYGYQDSSDMASPGKTNIPRPSSAIHDGTSPSTEGRRMIQAQASRRITRSATRSSTVMAEGTAPPRATPKGAHCVSNTGEGGSISSGPQGEMRASTSRIASPRDPPSAPPTSESVSTRSVTPQNLGRISKLPRPAVPGRPQSVNSGSRSITPEASMGSQTGVQPLPPSGQRNDTRKTSGPCIHAKFPITQTHLGMYLCRCGDRPCTCSRVVSTPRTEVP